jgi:hypothetical protein
MEFAQGVKRAEEIVSQTQTTAGTANRGKHVDGEAAPDVTARRIFPRSVRALPDRGHRFAGGRSRRVTKS